MTFYLDLFLMLAAAILMGLGAQRIGMPIVVGQLLAGVILGPSLLNLVQISHSIEFMAEIGVMILMFIVGLETDIKQLKANIKPSLLVAVLGAIFPMVVFTSSHRCIILIRNRRCSGVSCLPQPQFPLRLKF